MRKAWKKAVSVLLTLVLIFGVLPGINVSAEDEGGQGSGNSVEITLDNGTYDDTYKNKYGTIQYSTNYRDNSTSAEWKEISELKASDNQGKSKYTIQGENVYIKITYAQGSTYKAAIPNGVEVKDGVPIEITGGHIEFTDTSAGGGSQGGNPPQPTGVSLQFEGNAWSSYQNMKLYAGLELYVNPDNTGFVTLTDLLNQNKAAFDESGMVCLLDESVTSVSIYAQLEKKDEYEIQFHGATQAVGTSEDTAITVNGTQHIQIDRKCLTVTWAYDDTYGEDGRIEHGTAEIIKINGQDVSQMTFSNFANNPGDKSGGHLAVKRDDVVTIKLIPDYGYQLSGASINGVTLAPQTEVSTFTFKMPDTNVHFKGIFTQTQDEIKTTGTKVSSASFENGANAAPSGNLRLTVADSNEDTTNALAQVENITADNARLVSNLHANLGGLYRMNGHPDLAREHMEKSISLLDQFNLLHINDSIPQIANYAMFLTEQQEPERGISELQKLSGIIKEYHSDDCLDYAKVQETLGTIYLMTANLPQAKTHFKRAFKIYEKIWADEPEMIEAKYQEIQELYPQIGFCIGKNLSGLLTK